MYLTLVCANIICTTINTPLEGNEKPTKVSSSILSFHGIIVEDRAKVRVFSDSLSLPLDRWSPTQTVRELSSKFIGNKQQTLELLRSPVAVVANNELRQRRWPPVTSISANNIGEALVAANLSGGVANPTSHLHHPLFSLNPPSQSPQAPPLLQPRVAAYIDLGRRQSHLFLFL